MRPFPLRRDLGLQLLALSVLFIGLVVAGTLLFENLAGHRLEADVKAADLGLARAIAQETDIGMVAALEAVRRLGEEPAVVAADEAGMATLFRSFLRARNDVNLVYRLGPDGLMLYHYPPGPASTVGTDFSFRDYFRHALTQPGPLVSKGRISPTTDQPVATAVMPLYSQDGQFLGLAGTNIKLEALSQTLERIVAEYPAGDGLQILIIDAAGQIIAHPEPALLLRTGDLVVTDVLDAVLDGQSGNQIASNIQNEELLYSYVPINSIGWGVVVSRPTAVAFATPVLFQQGAMLSIFIFLLGGLFFWLGLSHYFIQPLRRLAVFSQSIGQNKAFSEAAQRELRLVARRPDQIGHLTRSMQRMQESIEARLNELGTLLQTSAAVVSTLDLQTVLDRILEQVKQLLDIHMCAIFALDESEGTFRAQASLGLGEWYRLHTQINPDEYNSVTMRAIRSGEPIQVSDTETNPTFKGRRHRARAAGYRSVLALPLHTQHAPPSALLVFRPDAHVFSEREISLLSNFANQAAMAIENATLYAHSDMRLQEQTRRLEALIQSMQDGLILENLEGQILYANRRIEELCGTVVQNVRGEKVDQLMQALVQRSRSPDEAARAVERAVQGEGKREAEFAVDLPEGTRYLRLKLFDVTDSQHTLIGRGRIVQDITQRHQIDRMKSSLISTVSHELRTPLAAIKGYATTLLAEDVEWDRESQQEFLTIISRESDHLSELVNELLDMSRIEAGTLTVSRQPCELLALVEQAAQRAHPPLNGRLRVQIPFPLPPLYADPQRIVVVLRNLIENATRYGGNVAPVQVGASLENGMLVVRVEDEGPGIPLEHREHVFDSFYQVENGLTRSKPGAGLGLAISRGFVQAHGGQIWIEARDRGTCVAFSLPLEDE